MKKYFVVFFLILIQGCSSVGDDSTATAPPAGTTATFVILNQMTTTGLAADGIEMGGIYGDSSAGHKSELFVFWPYIPYGQSATVTLSSTQCDIFWDFVPYPIGIVIGANTGVQTFFPCNETKNCTAVIIDINGVSFADLEGDCN